MPNENIMTVENVREVFAEMRENGINPEDALAYSYYFVGKDAESLQKLAAHLEDEGYDVVEIFELTDEAENEGESEGEDFADDEVLSEDGAGDIEDFDDDDGLEVGDFVLEVTKTETHTPESLVALDKKFNALVSEYGAHAFDGWEVAEEYDEDDIEGEE